MTKVTVEDAAMLKGDVAASQGVSARDANRKKRLSVAQARAWRSRPARVVFGALVLIVVAAIVAIGVYRVTHTGHDVGDTLTYSPGAGDGAVSITLLSATRQQSITPGATTQSLTVRVHFVNNTVGDLHFKTGDFLIAIANSTGFFKAQGTGVVVLLAPGKSIESQMIFQLPAQALQPELFWWPYVLDGTTNLTGADAPCWWYLGYYDLPVN